jgi:hypothetical protein
MGDFKTEAFDGTGAPAAECPRQRRVFPFSDSDSMPLMGDSFSREGKNAEVVMHSKYIQNDVRKTDEARTIYRQRNP